MSAAEVIEEIKRLPKEEREKVIAFLTNKKSEGTEGQKQPRYMDSEKAKAISAKVFSEHAELFRKLAR